MSKRFAWLLGLVVLVAIALLVACGNTYNTSYDGLVLITSQGSGLLETFSFNLNSGSIAAVDNPPNDTGNESCVLQGLPSSIVVDPAGAYAYAILTASPSVCGSSSNTTGILAFKVNSNGRMTQVGSITPDPNPIGLVMDTTGKYLFVAEGLSTAELQNWNNAPPSAQPPCAPTSTQYGVCVYSISGGQLTSVPQTFTSTLPPGSGFQPPNIAALAVTPMVFPGLVNGIQQAVCSSPGINPPTSEYLYAADAQNGVVWEYVVNTSTGALSNPPNVGYFFTGPAQSTPSGVAVDACNRFVYVSNTLTNNISAFTMCNGTTTQSIACPKAADGRLIAVSGSPFTMSGGANGPAQMMTDPYGNNLYVLDTLSNQISTFKISQISGSLQAGSPAVVQTGLSPTSFTIRADDNWLFVADFNQAEISQYTITPSTGALTPLPPTITDNQPWGVAVK